MEIFFTVTHWLGSALAKVAALCVIGAVALTGVEIIGRRLFGFSTKISEEVSAYMLVGITFLALAYTFVRGGHIKVDLVLRRLPQRGQIIMNIFNHFLGLGFCATLTYLGVKVVIQNIQMHTESNTILGTPLAIPSAAVPLGSGVISLVILAHIIRLVRTKKVPAEGGNKPIAEDTQSP